ncbi:MAG: YhbY family RNA-binding protein [Oscillospiraceae bacterium]|nr:YhbY family RNA-binding protein [Oscillospiraceae bacterium]
MLTSKQRAQLKALAAAEDTILIVGKGGLTENLIAQAADALRARELVKGRVLESALLSAREAGAQLAEACKAELVHVIGSRFVLFRRNTEAPKIELVRNNPKNAKKRR